MQKATKAAYKADKSNKALKKAYKAAKAALTAAQESETTETPAETEVEAAPAEEEAPEASPMDTLMGLKKGGENKEAAAGPSHDHSTNPPNPSVYCGNLSWDIDDDAIK